MDFFKSDWTVGIIFVLCVALAGLLAGMSLQAGLGIPQGATSESRTQISGKAAP